jgi:hypothetical protein
MGFGFSVGLCFDGNSTVITPQGAKRLCDLRLGDKVRVVQSNGRVEWSDVCAWAHREPNRVAKYLNLTTQQTGRSLTISPEHLVAVVRNGQMDYTKAGTLTNEDRLLACDVGANAKGGVWAEQIKSITQVESLGVYAPVTTSGTVVVNGIVASCYAAVGSHRAAHAAMKPVRSQWKRHPERAEGHHDANHTVKGSHAYVNGITRVVGH